MKQTIQFFFIALLMIFTGCTSEGESDFPEAEFDAQLLANIKYPLLLTTDKMDINLDAKASRQAGILNDEFMLPPPEPNPQIIGGGTAFIIRNPNGITVQVKATGLNAGHAYTTWFLIDDGDGDFFVLNCAGNIVGGTGNSTFTGHLSTGQIGPENGTDILFNPTVGSFNNPQSSIVWIHVVDHGPAGEDGPGTIPENIHEITGGNATIQEWVFFP